MREKYHNGLLEFAIGESLNTMYKTLFTKYRYGQADFEKEDAKLYLIKTKRFFVQGKKKLVDAIMEIDEGIARYQSLIEEEVEL